MMSCLDECKLPPTITSSGEGNIPLTISPVAQPSHSTRRFLPETRRDRLTIWALTLIVWISAHRSKITPSMMCLRWDLNDSTSVSGCFFVSSHLLVQLTTYLGQAITCMFETNVSPPMVWVIAPATEHMPFSARSRNTDKWRLFSLRKSQSYRI